MNPAARGECRVFNQSIEQFSVQELAKMVQAAARKMGLPGEIDFLPPPRVEAESHHYNAKHSKLIDLEMKPHYLSDSLLASLLNIAAKYSDRIDSPLFLPPLKWRHPRNERKQRQGALAAVSLGQGNV